MRINRRAFFAKQLAYWLYNVSWRYATLVGIAIDCVRDLPANADQVLHNLLHEYPAKPSQAEIENFLLRSEHVSRWFSTPSNAPAVIKYNLDPAAAPTLVSAGLPFINTVAELAAWLDISLSELNWLADLKRPRARDDEHFDHYIYQLLDKPHGEFRVIEKPKYLLKKVQRKIHNEILGAVPIHDAAHGFRNDRGCQTHAAIHVGQEYLFMFDLAECFHSIRWSKIKSMFSHLGYSLEVARYLSALCTHKSRLDSEARLSLSHSQVRRVQQRHLPQGAPSSPTLANAALLRLDTRLFGLANSLDLRYSRYADDLALSGNTRRDWFFLEPLIGAICLEEGLTLNYRKSRTKRPHQKQKLVGIVVNEKLNIDRKYYERIKATLTNCVRHGLESQNRGNHEHFRAHLVGCVQHVKTLNKHKGTKLEKLLAKL